VDDYHGVEVADPYRWLENDVREDDEVKAWVDAQNAVTFGYLEGLDARAAIEARLTELWNYEKYQTPYKSGGRYFFRRNDGLQNQFVLYTMDTLDGEPEILMDPNGWSEDGTVALSQAAPSPDGRYLGYTIQDGGSDWRTARIMDLETRELLPETLEWLKFTGLQWAADGSGFYYSRYPRPEEGAEFQSLNKNQAVYFHAVGTDQAEDRLVYARSDNPDWGFFASPSHDDRHLVIHVWKGTDDRNQLVYQDLTDPAADPFMLVDGFEAGYTFLGSDGDTLFFQTNLDAPMNRVVAIDMADRDAGWREVIAEDDDKVLQSTAFIGGRLLAEYLDNVKNRVIEYGTDGERIRELELPGIGSVGGFSGDPDDTETFYSYTSYNNPGEIRHYDLQSGEQSLFRRTELDFDPDDYVVKQVFYDSKDGTRVPMFIVHRADVELDGSNPTILYGYGGFNISLTPGFSITQLAWMEMGGVYAIANLRGGGEFGEAWHKAGTKDQKQNVFDDFIAAGEYLVAENYTSPEHLGIFGGSNGGLLVGAVTNQRPDLFAAAIPAVGVMDMLRFDQFTAGRFWVDDYGSAQVEEEFPALYAYSPYHNIVDGVCYPAVMATTADTDDRVVPGHTFKYMARLQAAQGCANPVLVRIETRAGHGAGTPTAKIIEQYADRWAFLMHHLSD
jgi:prolyl oligopeptidase